MGEPPHRIIFHVDMDQFFAAVEEKLHPELKGKPVVVGHDPKGGKGRGVVSTCNYEARKYGIKSGMPITKAWRLCPNAAFLPLNIPLYLQVSSRIMNILSSFANKFESWGIDEAFLDVSSRIMNYEEARQLAMQIKKTIFEKEGLTCSIGIAPNKLVAKIASDMQKPDGLTVVKDEEVKMFEPLDIDKLLWVGKKTARKLNALGIRTIGDLARYDASVLAEKFGVVGRQLFLYAQGIDPSEVGFKGEVKSIGRNITFEKDTSDWSLVLKILDKLCDEVHKEAKEYNFLFKTVTVTVRYRNFETHTHSKTLPFLTNRLGDFKKAAHELLQPYLQPGREIRLIGARVSSLVSADKQTRLV